MSGALKRSARVPAHDSGCEWPPSPSRGPLASGGARSGGTRVTPHEAVANGRFTTDNAKQMGAKGAAARERNLAERATETRQELATHTEEATQRLVEIIRSGKDSDALRAVVALLDRTGVGPHSSQDVTVGTTLIGQLIQEADARLAAEELALSEHDPPGLPP